MGTFTKQDTALILVDPYNGFLSEKGSYWPALAEVAKTEHTLEHLRQLLAAVRKAGMRVFIAPHRRWREGDFEGWTNFGREHRVLRDEKLFADGTFDGEWHPEFGPKPGDVVAFEHWGIGGFGYTDLDLQLRQRGIKRVIIAGMTATGCVEGTGRAAMDLGYSVILVRDATSSFSPEMLHAAYDFTGRWYADEMLTTDELVTRLA